MDTTLSTSSSLTATALLLNLPAGILCGIDLLSFTTSTHFHGIKDIPPGWHFIFTSETTSHSIRDGFWFHFPSAPTSSLPTLLVRKWDPSTASLRSCEDPQGYRSQLPGLWEKNLSPYRQSASKDGKPEAGDWPALTQHIMPCLLSHLMQSDDWRITSTSSAKQDRDDIPGLTAEEVGEEMELGVLGIDLRKTWRQGATGRERTEGALDRSWALGDVIDKWQKQSSEEEKAWTSGDVVLGQMEACFLMVLTVANYSCLEEWKRVVGLVLTCKRALREREDWFASLLVLLRKQLERCEDVEGGLFDMSDDAGGQLKKWLKGFKMTLDQVFDENEGDEIKEELEALEAFLKKEYGWELGDEFVRSGMVDLEDGEQIYVEVEDMDGQDETGEYAPVIVDIDEIRVSGQL